LKNIFFCISTLFLLAACTPQATVKADNPEPTKTDKQQNDHSVSGTEISIGQSFSIDSAVFGGNRTLNVRLPSGYADNPDKTYPVVYLIDGGVEQDFPHIAGIAQHADISWTFEPFILVGIETVDRRAEISPPAKDPRYDAIAKVRGGADSFRRFIADEVIPWTQSHYRSSDERAVLGESLAALFIVDTLLREADMFTTYIAISPSLYWDDALLATESGDLLKGFDAKPRRLYLSMADEGGNMQLGMDTFISSLAASAPASLQWSYTDRRDSEHHGSILHISALDALRRLYPIPSRTGSPSDAFYIYQDGIAPPLSERAKANVQLDCNKENAVRTNLKIINSDPYAWRGMCVELMLGPQSPDATGTVN